MRKSTVIAAVTAIALCAVGDPVPPGKGTQHWSRLANSTQQWRNHHSIASVSDRAEVARATVIWTVGQQKHEKVVLLRLKDGTMLRIDYEVNFVGRNWESFTYRDLSGGGEFRTVTLFPWTSSDRDDALKKAENPNHRGKSTITVSSGSRSISLPDKTRLEAGHREEARKLPDPRTLRLFGSTRGMLAVPQFAFACIDLELFFEPGSCGLKEMQKPEYAFAEIPGDCEFDSTFGFPCSPAQKERVTKSRGPGKRNFNY